MVLIIMLVSQGRIEYDTFKHKDVQSGILFRLKQWMGKVNQEVSPEPDPNNGNGLKTLYSLSITRLAFLFGTTTGGAGLAMALFGFTNIKVLLLLGTFIVQVTLPLLFILSHKNCRKNIIHKLSHFDLFQPEPYNISNA